MVRHLFLVQATNSSFSPRVLRDPNAEAYKMRFDSSTPPISDATSTTLTERTTRKAYKTHSSKVERKF